MNGNAVGLERRRIWIVFEFSLICQFLFAILGGRKRLADFSENFEVEERHMNNTYISIQVYGLEFLWNRRKLNILVLNAVVLFLFMTENVVSAKKK